MAYLLIILIILFVLAPLVWVKSSPRQQHVAQLRHLATDQGLRVTICHSPDAREGEGQLEQVNYCLQWPVNLTTENKPEQWLLLHHSRRGDPSPWQNWTWLKRPRHSATEPSVNKVIDAFSTDVTGLSSSKAGVQFYWREKGSADDLMRFIEALKTLQKSLLETQN